MKGRQMSSSHHVAGSARSPSVVRGPVHIGRDRHPRSVPRVEIDVSEINPAATAAVEDRYGLGRIRLAVSGPVGADACSTTLGAPPSSNCGPPWKGALAIYPSGPSYCTSGFVVRKWLSQVGEWAYALWTAGHCAQATWR